MGHLRTRAHAALVVTVGIVLSVVAILTLVGSATAAPTATAPTVVRVTIWPNLAITLAPKTFKHGTVLFKIKNRDSIRHEFLINGVTSSFIKPHMGTGTMTVRFAKPNLYFYSLPDYKPTSYLSPYSLTGGQVKVT